MLRDGGISLKDTWKKMLKTSRSPPALHCEYTRMNNRFGILLSAVWLLIQDPNMQFS